MRFLFDTKSCKSFSCRFCLNSCLHSWLHGWSNLCLYLGLGLWLNFNARLNLQQTWTGRAFHILHGFFHVCFVHQTFQSAFRLRHIMIVMRFIVLFFFFMMVMLDLQIITCLFHKFFYFFLVFKVMKFIIMVMLLTVSLNFTQGFDDSIILSFIVLTCNIIDFTLKSIMFGFELVGRTTVLILNNFISFDLVNCSCKRWINLFVALLNNIIVVSHQVVYFTLPHSVSEPLLQLLTHSNVAVELK